MFGNSGWRGKCRPFGWDKQVKAMALCCCRALFLVLYRGLGWPSREDLFLQSTSILAIRGFRNYEQTLTQCSPIEPHCCGAKVGSNWSLIHFEVFSKFLRARILIVLSSTTNHFPVWFLLFQRIPAGVCHPKPGYVRNLVPLSKKDVLGKNALNDYLISLCLALESSGLSFPKST